MNTFASEITEMIKENLYQLFTSPNVNTPIHLLQDSWKCVSADEAVSKAKAAQKKLLQLTEKKRRELIEAMRCAAMDHAERLAELAHQETGYGNTAHKILKNRWAAQKTPGMEDHVPQAFTGDYGMTLVERAPFGVIGSITPSTNPTSTIINNAISMIAAGNAVVFNPHPSAANASMETMKILHEAIAQAGGPAHLIATVEPPTLESGKALMEHPDVKLLSITGGEAVVAVAMKTGKKVVAAGPGNPPVIVDETADIAQAAQRIVDGASFDCNVLCVAEKEVFAVHSVFDSLMAQIEAQGAFVASGEAINKVEKTVLCEEHGKIVVNKRFVGKSAAYILEQSDISYTGNPRLITMETDEKHPFVYTEMLMPVLPMVRAPHVDEAIQMAVRAEGGRQHSAIMHSTNVHHLTRAAQALDTTIFVKNAPSYAGLGFMGEGFATLTIATPTGEGLTSAKTFTRIRRCVLKDDFKIV